MIVVLARDLMIATRIAESARRAGRPSLRIDDPNELPEPDGVELVLVDWADRLPAWAPALHAWRERAATPPAPRVVLFGPHTDLEAHAAARDSGLGPMLARSKLVRDLPGLVAGAPSGDG